MFNKTLMVSPRQPAPRVTVNQQPHDAADAARLYGEIEDKAIEQIRHRVVESIPSIGVEYVRYEMALFPQDMKRKFFIAFRINGQDFTVKVSASDYEDPQAHLTIIANAIAQQIMQHVAYESRKGTQW